jgi:hypothetical protein
MPSRKKINLADSFRLAYIVRTECQSKIELAQMQRRDFYEVNAYFVMRV